MRTLALVFPAILSAQVAVKREQPPDFRAVISTLEAQPKQTAKSTPPRPWTPPAMPMTAVGLQALAASAKAVLMPVPPVPGADGRITYEYGAGMPELICAPLQICVIELQAGERVTGEPQTGDSLRWKISPAVAGNSQMVILKPTEPGLGTTLFIPTDRRAYYIRLVSDPQRYVPMVSFHYGSDAVNLWLSQEKPHEKQPKGAETADESADIRSIGNANADYKIRGSRRLRPELVFDDGSGHTYLRMSSELKRLEAPVLRVAGPQGKLEHCNYRVKGNIYIVDQLFDKARLTVGAGRHAKHADVERGS